MSRFVEYSINHPFLVAAAAILAILTLVFEFRQRARGSSAIGPADAVRLVNAGALVVDVRDEKAYEGGHIIDARSIPAGEMGQKAESLTKFKEKPVVVYCDSGLSSATAVKAACCTAANSRWPWARARECGLCSDAGDEWICRHCLARELRGVGGFPL